MKESKHGVFVDTNILVYAHDSDAGPKRQHAKQLLHTLWSKPVMPFISVQVLQELYVNLVRKNVPDAEAKEIIDDYLQWNVIANTTRLLLAGIELKERFMLSLWDALILAAATSAGVDLLYSEDLNAGQRYGDIQVVNPLEG